MAHLNTDSAAADLDLSEFHQIFFEEADENIDAMEQALLTIDVQAADDEELNAIFRCAHSVKGGAATFGFVDVAELTHQMETLLDKLRRHELAPSSGMVDVLLRAGDTLKTQLARHRDGGGEPIDTQALLADIGAFADQAVSTATAGAAAGGRVLELAVGPLADPAVADQIAQLFDEIPGLGTITPLQADQAACGMVRFKVTTASSNDELVDLMSFHVAREQLHFTPLDADTSVNGVNPGAPAQPPTIQAKPAAMPAEPTLRVSVDQLLNLVGELVITQAMLAQHGVGMDNAPQQPLATALAQLERNTRDLQDAVMAIRMIPIAVVFSRFPRMLRDLAPRLGKKIELVTQGEATELDKGLVEKIADPLTHLVRNCCDHGIEPPAERRAMGKPEAGTIVIAASHQSGSIVIEVRDDGRGLNRDKLLRRARAHGITAPDDMPDAQVWQLIFAPGVSTADVVTEVSGRGVGMDVVKKNITALGGTVQIDSVEGVGMSVKVRLPLTLAIVECITVGVADECYLLPLSSVVESLQPTPQCIRTIGGGMRVVRVHDDYLPVVELRQIFAVPQPAGAPPTNPVMVVVEAAGARIAMLVDEILGQQQAVVKNLQANFRRVEHVAGATVMGDGRVALILDVGSLVRRLRR